MNILASIIILATQIFAKSFWEIDKKDIVFVFNKEKRTWKMDVENNHFDFSKPQTFKNYLGREINLQDGRALESAIDGVAFLHNLTLSGRFLQTIPTSYNLTAQYPSCWSIGYIRDQGKCGSCWAVTTGSVLSDRFCIKNYNNGVPKQRHFSYQDLLECCPLGFCFIKNGCDGGNPARAFYYAQLIGLVTGENYQNKTTCKPYVFSPTEPSRNAPSCVRNCTNTTTKPAILYSKDLLKIKYFRLYIKTSLNNMTQIGQNAILYGGSILTYISVWEDFYYYKSGVYSVTQNTTALTNNFVGYHVLRFIGWGYLNNVAYWIGANTWGSGWGINGCVLMKRGSNEAGSEEVFLDSEFF